MFIPQWGHFLFKVDWFKRYVTFRRKYQIGKNGAHGQKRVLTRIDFSEIYLFPSFSLMINIILRQKIIVRCVFQQPTEIVLKSTFVNI